jgi:hypothetical protein
MPNGRCRMHGGKCRGPATPEGRQRMTAANTKHGNFSAHARAEKHHVRTSTARNRLACAATLLWPYLPPDMAARLAQGPAAFFPPAHPSNLPYLTPQDAMACNVETRCKTSATPASARRRKPAPKPTGRAAERLAIRAELAAQAPWRQAIAQARVAKRAIRKAQAAWRQKQRTQRNGVQRENAPSHGNRHATPAALAAPAPPPANWPDLTLLQRELAARLAGLRSPRPSQPPSDAAHGPQEGSTNLCTKSPGRIAAQREPTARPAGTKPPTTRPPVPSAPARPASHQPSVPTAADPSCSALAGRQTKTAERIAVQRENTTPPPLTRLTPTKAEAMRTTTPANTQTPDLATQLAQRFGHPRPAPGWCIPHAMPATDPVANAVHSFPAEHKRPTGPAAS